MRYDNPFEATRSSYRGRIAIWNKAKMIIAIAMGILVVDISLFINSRYLLQIIGEYLISCISQVQ
jgi:hypothetical protein